MKSKNPLWFTKLMLLISVIGPGIITANIDNDAGGIATYTMAGAKTGYRLLWVFLPITFALIIVQEMSARLGIVSGKGLADLIRERFGLKIAFYTLISLIFADLGNTMAEFAGIAASGEIFGVSKYISVPISAIFVWLLITKGDYKIIERVFLMGCTLYLSYIVCGIVIGPPWKKVFTSLVTPNFSTLQGSDFPILIGLIGTTITPWMQFYIQAAVVEKGISKEHLFHSRVDIVVGCILMSIVTLFIVICSAATLHEVNPNISGAKEAALALAPLAGQYSQTLFALGLFNASIFSAALLPLATSYYVCEGLGWEAGVDKSFKEAPNFFTIFTALIVIGALLVLIPHINLFQILLISQIINGILIPLILFYLLILCNDPDILGEYTNSFSNNLISGLIILLMMATNISMLYFEIFKD